MSNPLNKGLKSEEFLKIVFYYKDDKIVVRSDAAITTGEEKLIVVKKLVDLLKEVVDHSG